MIRMLVEVVSPKANTLGSGAGELNAEGGSMFVNDLITRLSRSVRRCHYDDTVYHH